MKRSRVSYPACFKLQVVKAAEESNNLEAARKFSVDESNVHRRRKTLCSSRSPKQKERKEDQKLANFLNWRKKSTSGWMRNDKMAMEYPHWLTIGIHYD